jgi:hypothetical protein
MFRFLIKKIIEIRVCYICINFKIKNKNELKKKEFA